MYMSATTRSSRTEDAPPYQALDPAKHQLRLLEFTKTSEADVENGKQLDIACTVKVYSLGEYNNEYVEFASRAPSSWTSTEKLQNWKKSHQEEYPVRYLWGDYVAMSHTWGDRSKTKQILVNGKVITIPYNLAEGLMTMSKYPPIADGRLKVWNDFLCLDQQNKIEVQREIKRMSTIFSNAYAVMAWIGPEMDESHLVMDMLNDINNLKDDSSLLIQSLQSISKDVWKAFGYFLRRPYWRRMWVVQELTLSSPQTVLLCGSQLTELRNLWNLVFTIIGNVSIFHNLLAMPVKDKLVYYDRFRHETFSVCARLFYLQEIDKTIQDGNSCEILQLLDICRGSAQQDARDKVYGVFGLLPPGVPALIEPDLDKAVHEVYADLVRATVKATRQLDILQNCRLDPDQPQFPTWAPDLLGTSMSHSLGSRAIMDAGGDLGIEPSFSSCGRFLNCKGVLSDVIDHMTPPQWPVIEITQEQADESVPTASIPPMNKATAQEFLWKTLVGGSNGFPHDSTPPPEYAQLLDLPWPNTSDEEVENMAEHLINQNWCSANEKQDLITFLLFRSRAKRDFDVCGHRLDSFFAASYDEDISINSVTEQTPGLRKRILRQASNTMKRRRLLVTRAGRIGVAIRQARKGDRIAILQGCNTPMILRPASTSLSGLPSQPDTPFMVVGDCYIHGLMNGEALTQQGSIQDLVLC